MIASLDYTYYFSLVSDGGSIEVGTQYSRSRNPNFYMMQTLRMTTTVFQLVAFYKSAKHG